MSVVASCHLVNLESIHLKLEKQHAWGGHFVVTLAGEGIVKKKKSNHLVALLVPVHFFNTRIVGGNEMTAVDGTVGFSYTVKDSHVCAGRSTGL